MFKNTSIWLPSYLKQQLSRRVRRGPVPEPLHIMFCFADHYEPDWGGVDKGLQRQRVERWVEEYPAIAARHADADGYPPSHTFFYPAEIYDPEHLRMLCELCRKGFGEVEIHLHHDGDDEASLRQKLQQAKVDFGRHGGLGYDRTSRQTRFGFIHGNWALNNARPDGRWCGVNRETQLLMEEGCYADFTLPSAPSQTQTRTINRLYYDVHNTAARPKSHDTGRQATFGVPAPDGALLLVQGPLALNWHRRKAGILPRIENGDITGVNPATPDRVRLWIRQAIGLKGKPDWVFVKVHTHGAPEKNADGLLSSGLNDLFTHLEEQYNDGRQFQLHYVSAREMVNIIRAGEAGLEGNPCEYRDYEILSYLFDKKQERHHDI